MGVWLGRLLLASAAVLLLTRHWLAAAIAFVPGLALSGILPRAPGGSSAGSGSSDSNWTRPIDYDQDSGYGSDDNGSSNDDSGSDGGSSDGGGSSD